MKDYSPETQIVIQKAQVMVSTYKSRMGQLKLGVALLTFTSIMSLLLCFNHPWNQDTPYRVMLWVSLPISYFIGIRAVVKEKAMSDVIMELSKN